MKSSILRQDLLKAILVLLSLLTLCALLLSTLAVEKDTPDAYKQRRRALMEKTPGGLIILFGARTQGLAAFRQENNFMYLTGVATPGAILVLDASRQAETLYVPERNPRREQYYGAQIGPDSETIRMTGIDSVKPTDRFLADLSPKAAQVEKLYMLYPVRSGSDISHTGDEEKNLARVRNAAPYLSTVNVAPLIAALRKAKSPKEIQLLKKAVEITGEAQREVAKIIRPGLYEYEAQALIEYVFRRNGAERPAYPSIIGSGVYSTVLHYNENSKRMEAGELVVIDVGAEYSFYTADVTRTYPVSGRFTPRQREIYQIVLDAQTAAIHRCRPGARIDHSGEIHQAAFQYIDTHGKDARGGSLGSYFIHGTSHFLGMDVHDVGDGSQPLKPGEVITIEPGIYIPEEKLGARIEDDFLVTETGCTALSQAIPKEIDAVEQLMKDGKRH